ncbi:MAG: CarD family transcriptional regulator, partial [Planctomyces sp.]
MAATSEPVPQNLADVTALLTALPGFAEVLQALRSGRSAAVDGAWGSSCALTISALAGAFPDRHVLIVQPTIRDAEEFADELAGISGLNVQRFPAWEGVPDEDEAADTVGAIRMALVRRLNSDGMAPMAVVTSLPALLQPVPSRESIRRSTRTLKAGEELSLDEFSGWLTRHGFERVTAVELPGEFSIHGGILDLFPATEADPVRIELFGDEIESIRSFAAESQTRLADLPALSLTIASDKPAASSGSRAAGAGPAPFARFSESLLDSAPPNLLVILSDLQQSISEGRLYLQRLANPTGLFGVDATMARLTSWPSVTVDALGIDSFETTCRFSIEPMERFSGSRRDALTELAELLNPGERVLLCCHNEGELERLRELLEQHDQQFSLSLAERVCTTAGQLRRGFRIPSRQLVVLSDNELFSRTPARTGTRRRRADSRAIDSFLDLKEGDLVVHISHGIARYRGMKMTQLQDVQEEQLILEFRDGVTVCVPSSLIHLVQKYIGPAKTTPEL